MNILDAEFAVPVELGAFKRAVHLTEADTDDDALIAALLLAATEVVEAATRRITAPRSIEFVLPCASWRRWWFPVVPVAELTKLEYREAGGDWVELDKTQADLQCANDEPQLVIPAGFDPMALGAAEMRVTATVGTAKPHARSKQAIILIAKEWLEAGIAIEEAPRSALSFGPQRMLGQMKYGRPQVLAEA